MAKTIVRLDRIANGHVDSFKFATDLEQGTFVSLNALNDNDIYTGVAVDLTKPVVFHASVPMTYKDSGLEIDYVLPAGVAGRGIVLQKGDIVTITNNGVNGVPAVNKVLAAEAGQTKGKIYADAATAVGDVKLICERINVSLAGQAASTYRVL